MNPTFEPADPAFETRIRESFARQRFMATLGATLEKVQPGAVELHVPFRMDLTQQHGFLHAGVLSSVADSACGYAALSLMPPGAAVLSIEFKVNLLSPGEGERFIARGEVLKAGRTITVTSGEVFSVHAGTSKRVMTLTATMMTVTGRPGLKD